MIMFKTVTKKKEIIKYPKPEIERSVGAEFVPFDALLEASDIITICCALTQDTKDMLDYSASSIMKKRAAFANSVCDGIVDRDGLESIDVFVDNVGIVVSSASTPEKISKKSLSEVLKANMCIVLLILCKPLLHRHAKDSIKNASSISGSITKISDIDNGSGTVKHIFPKTVLNMFNRITAHTLAKGNFVPYASYISWIKTGV
ncbi:hypothetical protein EDC96DRAFT_545924 [Choanephora cucurbitarum]|nr:hypothetical protein EDC96DRAFT_545924 [Choanephora cucurbitarum]